MDVRYINPFINAVESVFNMMLETKVEFGSPFIKVDTGEQYVFFSAIDITGDATGTIALAFTRKTARSVAAKLTGITGSLSNDDLADALGETVNMVVGDARTRLTDLATQCTIPAMVCSAELSKRQGGRPTLCLPCDSELGAFLVEVSIVSKKSIGSHPPDDTKRKSA